MSKFKSIIGVNKRHFNAVICVRSDILKYCAGFRRHNSADIHVQIMRKEFWHDRRQGSDGYRVVGRFVHEDFGRANFDAGIRCFNETLHCQIAVDKIRKTTPAS